MEICWVSDVCGILITCFDSTLYDRLLTKFQEKFRCNYGFLGYIDHENSALVCPAISKGVYPLYEKRGQQIFHQDNWEPFWTEVIVKRRYLSKLHKRDEYPEGHIPIKNSLSGPIIVNNHVWGCVQLAGKVKGSFDEFDLLKFKELLNLVGPALEARRIMEIQSEKLIQVEKEKTAYIQQTLEREVRERTRDLTKANENLHKEIARRKQSEKELKKSNEELEQFASIAAHDIQSPVSTIGSFCQVLEEDYKDQLSSDAQEILGVILKSANKAQVLIRDLLNYSRSGTLKLVKKPTDLNLLIAEVVDAVKLHQPRARLKIDFLPTVTVDYTQIYRVFENLIANGLKFNNKANPCVRVYATRNPQNYNWIICVEDNGIGIDPKYAEKIFLIFQRLHPTSDFDGTGIGLAICKRIVGNHNGKIWLDSSYTGGSRFCFELPSD